MIIKLLTNLSLAVTWITENVPNESVNIIKEILMWDIENAICLLWAVYDDSQDRKWTKEKIPPFETRM